MKKNKLMLYLGIGLLVVALGMWYTSGREAAGPDPLSTEAPTQSGGLQNILTGTAAGWTDADGTRRYLLDDGTPASGWLNIDGVRYYLLEDGTPASGWTRVDGVRCFFSEDGTPLTGWQELDGSRYYLNANGAPLTGTHEIDGETYHFDSDGTFYNGWITIDSQRYYCLGDGSYATGKTVIDGETYYFSSTGVHVVIVNPWSTIPSDYSANLLPIDDTQFVEVSCYSALLEMLAACEADGNKPQVCSAYRTHTYQQYLYQKKVAYYLEEGYSQEDAEAEAATVVAVPGTSEHQLGLAVDIVDASYPYLTEAQEQTDTQKWLIEHCWEFGFILRYPVGSTASTGIIYEPWHYRYVGTEIALEIRDLGVTLEEYLGFTHE